MLGTDLGDIYKAKDSRQRAPRVVADAYVEMVAIRVTTALHTPHFQQGDASFIDEHGYGRTNKKVYRQYVYKRDDGAMISIAAAVATIAAAAAAAVKKQMKKIRKKKKRKRERGE